MDINKDVFSVKCDECCSIFEVSKDEFQITSDAYDKGENSMGSDITYYAEAEVQCPHCNNYVKIELSTSEYPEGCFSSNEPEITGGKFIDVPCLENK